MGDVLPDILGLVHIRRHHRALFGAAVPVYPVPADDFDFRDANDFAKGGRGVIKTAPIYGVLAEFDTPEDLVKAVRRARSAGYRRMDAYTPFPIEHLAEELGFHRTYLPLIVLI